MPPPLDVDSLFSEIFNEMQRRGIPEKDLERARSIMSDGEAKARIIESARIDRDKIEEATKRTNEIQVLSTRIIVLRYEANEAFKIMGRRLFQDNNETTRIANQLRDRYADGQDSLHLFIDDIHKLFIQSAEWGDLFNNKHVGPVIRIIGSYRNSFDHIVDMKGSGSGTDKAYQDRADINEDLLGHRVIKIEEFSLLQIVILKRIEHMLELLVDNAETWLKVEEQLLDGP